MATAFPYSTYIAQSTRGQRTYPTLSAQFADGRYRQSAVDGLAPVVRSYDWNFENLTLATYGAVMAYFDSVGMHAAFSWTPPGESIGNFVVVKEPQVSYPAGNSYNVTVSVKEDFSQ